MALAQLAGYAAFIVASIVLGTRLLLLSRRTGEWPERMIGAAYWLAGGLGYTSWLILGIASGAGAGPEQIKTVAVIGLGLTVLGCISNGIGTAMIFRSGSRWAQAFVTCAGLAMVASWGGYAVAPAGESTSEFWRTVLTVSPVYVWSAVEALALGRVLRKRAKLGLADPLVWNRTVQFGASSAAVVVSIAISFSAQMVYGATPPVWTATCASSVLVVGAAAIWLGFFPPAAYRARLAGWVGAN